MSCLDSILYKLFEKYIEWLCDVVHNDFICHLSLLYTDIGANWGAASKACREWTQWLPSDAVGKFGDKRLCKLLVAANKWPDHIILEPTNRLL